MTNEEAIKEIKLWADRCPFETTREAFNLAIKALKQQPETPQYKWVKIFENEFCNGYVCPKCGHKIQCTEQGLQYFDTCEVCGAEMIKEDKHD